MRRAETISIFPVGHAWKVRCGHGLLDISFADLGAAIDAAGELCLDGPVRIVVLESGTPAVRAAA